MRIVGFLLILAGLAHATTYTVTWDVGPPPTRNGVVEPYVDFQLFRCDGTFAGCPTSSSGLWHPTDTYDATLACPLPPTNPMCMGTTNQTGSPGLTVPASFYMTARSGTGANQRTWGPSNVVTVDLIEGDRPGSPPLNLRFSLDGSDIRFVRGRIGRDGHLYVDKTEPTVDPNTPILIVVQKDRRP